MLKVLHISAECYPAAKTGGLGDVVGSLPKYMNKAGVTTGAVIPKYATKWIHARAWTTVFSGSVRMGNDWWAGFTVQQESDNSLGFPLFVVDVPGLFDRAEIYGHGDEVERLLVFQQAVIQWIQSFPEKPRVLHCHDHHAGLLPWMLKACPEYRDLSNMPVVFTIHNGNYQGGFSWKKGNFLPYYEADKRWMIDWNGIVNPMAAAVRCAWAVTTVSPSYLFELHESSLGLEPLFHSEWRKQFGILNGIDAEVWDPKTDPMISHKLEDSTGEFKRLNKQALLENFKLDPNLPLFAYIGRMAGEKGADLLPDTIRNYIGRGGRIAFLVLGSGDGAMERSFQQLKHELPGLVDCYIGYHEGLSHLIYAGADFLVMPSRVEPCGLNQMYSMRYGTIPIVRAVGGLKDTVTDLDEPNGRGFRFQNFDVGEAANALHRAAHVWWNHPESINYIRERIMGIDFSWESAVERYFDVYRRFTTV